MVSSLQRTKSKDNPSTGKKQQWSKYLSSKLARGLHSHNPNSKLKQSYMNTIFCTSVKLYDGEKVRTTYCKNRWCPTCNRIRTAININRYAPEISKFGYPYFVTLTRPTVSIEELPDQIENMEKSWRQLYNYGKDKRKAPYAEGIRLRGIRKMECTLRPDGKYHYHYHVIVDGMNEAYWLRSEWLKRNPDADKKAQDIRPANAGSLMEVFKYQTKSFTDTGDKPHFERLDELYNVMRGKRTLAAFGIKVPKDMELEEFDLQSQDQKELQLQLGNQESIWTWDDNVYDWVNKETGELMINEPIPERVKKIAGEANSEQKNEASILLQKGKKVPPDS